MHYLKPIFTLPAANPKQESIRWDLAFLTDEDFIVKHGFSKQIVLEGFEKKG